MDLDCEIEAISRNLKATPNIDFITQSQMGALNGLINKGLDDRSEETRHQVLHLLVSDAMFGITGIEVWSAKNLTSTAATFLINLLLAQSEEGLPTWRLSDYGRELLHLAETRIKAQPFS